ncbi:MAG: Clp protease N-terminal domain-containing protein [Hyphomicrobiaceae bacterium]|nr:Clp protease N-terminal domain-containing protein [Hyphomicrobiaceae bacterium]
MAYRGQDLDLRVGRAPFFRNAALGETGDAGVARMLGRDEAIVVDETLLATCNHAYEAAVFNGSREVRLEHLVYALARVGAAAQILADLGIRPEHLRREAALAIAAETPATAADAKVDPATSDEVRAALRRASDRAHERGALAGVPDLLRTILSAGRDSATVALLSRASSDPQRLERWREDSLRRETATLDLVRVPPATDGTPAVLARLDQLELGLQLAVEHAENDRRTLQTLLHQVQEALVAVTSIKPLPPLPDRTDEIKQVVDARLQDVSELVLSLDERLHGLSQRAGAGAALPEEAAQRFDRLEQRIQEQGHELSRAIAPVLSERLSQLVTERIVQRISQSEASVAELLSTSQGEPRQGRDLEPVLAAFETSLREQLAKSGTGELGERLGQLEASVRTHLAGAEETTRSQERDLTEIFEALVKLGANQQTLANNLNTWRLDTSGDVSIVSNRIEALEATVLESLNRLGSELHMLRGPTLIEQEEPQPAGWSFKRWLFGTTRVLTPGLNRDGQGPVRHALARLRLMKK